MPSFFIGTDLPLLFKFLGLIEKKLGLNHQERAVLVGLIYEQQNEEQLQEYLDELAFLAETAGAIAIKRFVQKLPHPDSKTFIGKGKLEEIRQYIEGRNIDVAIFDDELTGAQITNIEKALDVKTIDRSDLILDIFARRAKTAQAKAQVELAQYQYLLPRLRGMWKHLERLGGGIGTRGPGESEIETDRRIVRDKISLLRKRLAQIDKQASTQRKDRGELVRVALVGYTNVGKSTLMNILGCLDTPTKGQYVLNGTDVSRMTDNELAEVRNREIGFVFQTFNLLPRNTALDNVALPLIYSGVNKEDRKSRAEGALKNVGLGNRMDHKPNELSGGQRQRVAVARALINNPSIILADEPTGNLDTKTSIEIMGLMEDIHAKGNTIILVTHEEDIALHAHRIVRMRDGLIENDYPNTNIHTVERDTATL